MYLREKKSKCPKKNFQSVKRGKKCLSVEFRVFEKKRKWKKKFGEKILGKILLSSYSLGKFLLICKLKFQRKKMETFKVFCG